MTKNKAIPRTKHFWTVENPQVMIERYKEDGKQLCRDIIGLNSEYDHDDLTQKIEDLILQYRAMAEGIENWWKYSHIGDYDFNDQNRQMGKSSKPV